MRAAEPNVLSSTQAMSNFKLLVSAPQPRAVVSENLKVEVTLKNESSAAVEVPRVEVVSEFEFLLKPAGNNDVQVIGARRAVQARSAGRGAPVRVERAPLAPGASLVYRENISKYVVGGIPAGQYRLSVAWDAQGTRLVSPDISVEVTPPNVKTLAVAGAARGGLGLIFAHQENSGNAIFQREGPAGSPLDGPAVRRINVTPPRQVVATAAAQKLDVRTSERWYAWLQDDGSLGGGLAWGDASYAAIAPTSLGLGSSSLSSLGWQFAPQSGLFVVLGLDESGRRVLALVTLRPREAAAVKRVPLGESGVPRFWSATLVGEEATAAIQLVTAEESADGTRLTLRTIRVATAAAETAKPLAEINGSILALTAKGGAGGTAGSVAVLSGPVGDPAELYLTVGALSEGQPPTESKIPCPADQDKRTPLAWAVAPISGSAVAMAKLRNQLLAHLGAGGAWSIVNADAAAANLFRIETVDDQTLAIWTDPVRGILSAPLR